MKKIMDTIKWRIGYLAGEPQPEMYDVFVDGVGLKAGDTLVFKSTANNKNGGIWVVQ